MTIITNKRKSGTTYTALVRKGKYRIKPITKTFPTKGQAKYWKSEQERLIDMKKYQDPRLADEVSLVEALNKYAEHSRVIRNKAESTIDREIFSTRKLLLYFGENTSISAIKPRNVSEYQFYRLGQGGSHSSIRQELALLSNMFNVAAKSWGVPIENPLNKVDRIPVSPGRERFLTEEEAEIIILESRRSLNHKFFPFVLLLMHTGMRTGEVARLNRKDIDLSRRIITIRETKTKKPRVIGVSHEVINALLEIKTEQKGYYFLKPNHRASRDTMLRPGCIFRECWKQLRKRIDRDYNYNKQYRKDNPDFVPIEPFRAHDIRHTAASHLLHQGVDIRIIADILGHSTMAMVMRYTHLFDESKVEYADKLSHLGTGNQNGNRLKKTN